MASTNTFRFETMLKLRRQKENEAQRTVAARLGQIRQLEDRQVALKSRITGQANQTRAVLGDGLLNLDELRLSRHWMIRLRQHALQAEAEVRTQRAILASERSRLLEAGKNRKVLSRLKERHLDRYLAEQERREREATDELNMLRFVHGRRDGAEVETP